MHRLRCRAHPKFRFLSHQRAAFSTKPRSIDFSDARQAFEFKTTSELWRSLLVFRACQITPLVKHSQWLVNTSVGIFGETLTMGVIKHTFFKHFCAGEDTEDLRPTVDFLKNNYDVGGILDYAAEADLEEAQATPATATPATATSSSSSIRADTPEGIQCRTYDYTNEKVCDLNRDIFLQCIRSVHDVSPEGFAAIKLTALGNPVLLERISTCLVEIERLFFRLARKTSLHDTNVLTRAHFKQGYQLYFRDATDEVMDQWFDKLDERGVGYIDPVGWVANLRIEDISELVEHCTEEGPLSRAMLDDEEIKLMRAMQERVHRVAEEARTLEVRLMIDAEQTYFQPAIDNFVLELQREYNREFPTIFNTYQCYLKDSFHRCKMALQRSKREEFWFGAKLVRGAYMVAERQRAKERGYPSPIHDTLEDTHRNYHRVMEYCFGKLQRANVMIASHNQKSVEHTIEKMAELDIDPANGGVYFGQLLGMMDHLTFTLGANGYKAYKYLPYGPIKEVIPYLLRRAQENSDIMGGVGLEIKLIQAELRRRRWFFSGRPG